MPSSPSDIRQIAERWFHEVWTLRRDATIDELWGDGFVWHFEGVGTITREQFKEVRRMYFAAMSDFELRVEDIASEGDRAVVRWRLTGRHDGNGFGVAPWGRRVDATGTTWFVVRGGVIVEAWDSWNHGEFIAGLRAAHAGDVPRRHGLTPRQAEVALLMAERRTGKEIAKQLDIRPNTARRHCQDVLRRLGLHDRKDVARVVLGEVDPPSHRSGEPARSGPGPREAAPRRPSGGA